MNDLPCRITSESDDVAYLSSACIAVLTMQTGFAMLESGSVTAKNRVNIAAKNLCDLALGVLAWYSVGWGIAFGNGASLVGEDQFFALDVDEYIVWFFQLSFAATASTIDSGAVAGRMKFWSYLALSFVTTAVTFPFAARWVWHPNGFLAQMGAHDFAGSSVVHLLGATSALVSAWVLGPRRKWKPGRGAAQVLCKRRSITRPLRKAVVLCARRRSGGDAPGTGARPAAAASPRSLQLPAAGSPESFNAATPLGSGPPPVSPVHSISAFSDSESTAHSVASMVEDDAQDGVQMLMGSLVLFISWFAFNMGSTLGVSRGRWVLWTSTACVGCSRALKCRA